MFCDDMGHFLKFLCIFLIFFLCFQIMGFPKEKEKEESSHRPATRDFVRTDRQCAFVDLKITFSCGLPI